MTEAVITLKDHRSIFSHQKMTFDIFLRYDSMTQLR